MQKKRTAEKISDCENTCPNKQTNEDEFLKWLLFHEATTPSSPSVGMKFTEFLT